MDCKNNIDRIKLVAESEEFYYQKIVDVLKEFEEYQIREVEINRLIDGIDFNHFQFDEYRQKYNEHDKLILLIGQIIAMIDLNGFNKNEWNLYEDKRTVARAGVRQNSWTKNLLIYKQTKQLDNLPDSVANALSFIKNPQNNLTQLSENHRKMTAIHLLGIPYNKENYFDSLKSYFKDELDNYNLKNKQNFGLLLSLLVYCQEIKEKWEKIDTLNYWLVGSKWDEIDKTEEFIQNGIWVNGFDDKYLKRVKSIKVGDKIAIKSSYVKSKNLPFDNDDKHVSIMKIKAIGEVVENFNDGRTISVDWDSTFEPKEIYVFSYRNTISKIDKSKWLNPIQWIFYGKEQDDFLNIMTTRS